MRPLGSAWLVLVLLVWLSAQSRAEVYSVTVSPETPTAQDTVLISIGGWFSDTCWSFEYVQCGSAQGDSIGIDVFTHDDWVPGVVCQHMMVPYGCDCSYGPMAAGHYIVKVTEHHDSLANPTPQVVVFEFEVLADTPVREMSWSRIRALYRPGRG